MSNTSSRVAVIPLARQRSIASTSSHRSAAASARCVGMASEVSARFLQTAVYACKIASA
jgi:hypothetical protein